MSNITYGRGQVEWALWRAFGLGRKLSDDIPKVFRARIKRLLDIDRGLDLSQQQAPPEAAYAFVEHSAVEKGELSYTLLDAFCLALGLDLLDTGFKQSEVVYLMRYFRAELEAWVATLIERPSLLKRRRYRPKDHPNLPTFTHKGQKYADPRVFVVISKVELQEMFPIAQKKLKGAPLFLEPMFCEGAEALSQTLSAYMPERRRVVMVLELTAIAQAVASYLDDAPEFKRGRPKG